MGLNNPEAGELTASQLAVLNSMHAVAAPSGYHYVARTIPALTANDYLALNVQNGQAKDAISSPNTINIVGGAAISSEQSFVGDSSLKFTASAHRVYMDNQINHDIGGGDWLVECAFYPTVATPHSMHLVSKFGADAGTKGWSLHTQNNSGQKIRLTYTTDGTTHQTVDFDGSDVVANAWNHVRMALIGTNLYCWLNGWLVGPPQNFTDSIAVVVQETEIGYGQGGVDTFTGYIDAVRINALGTLSTNEFEPQRAPFSTADQNAMNLERLNVNRKRVLPSGVSPTPQQGSFVYITQGTAETITIPSIADWGDWQPAYLFDGASGSMTMTLTGIDTVDDDGNDLVVSARRGMVKLHKSSSTNAVAEGDFWRP